MIKLYTEEQLIKAIKLAQECESDCGGVYFGYTETEVLGELTPIEIPSDEEIWNEAQIKKDNIKLLPFDTASFQFGALWLRDKIQGGNK